MAKERLDPRHPQFDLSTGAKRFVDTMLRTTGRLCMLDLSHAAGMPVPEAESAAKELIERRMIQARPGPGGELVYSFVSPYAPVHDNKT